MHVLQKPFVNDPRPLSWLLMKKYGFSHIRRWLWLFIFVVALTTVAAFSFIYSEIDTTLTSLELSLGGTSIGTPQDIPELLTGIKLRIFLLLTAGWLTILFLSAVWLRTAILRINRPIHAIRRAVFRLAQGKLNETVTINSQDELGQIGSNINELAANLQELLLHIWKQTGQCITTVEDLGDSINQLGDANGLIETKKQLQELTSAIENLREMAKAYVFYDVRLDGEHTIGIKNPGQERSSETS